MPYTVRVRAALARYLLSHPVPRLRQRLEVLRLTPFPPGSRSLAADPAWLPLSSQFPNLRAYVYGTNANALIYTYDSATESAVVELAVINGTIVTG